MNWTTESHCRNVSNRRIKPNIEIAYSWTVLNRSKATTTCRRKTGKYIGGNLLYYPNSVKTTRLFTVQLCGDVELNPGPVTKHPCKDISPVEQFMENNRLNNASYILHLNSRSLLPVIDQLRILFDESKPLIIAISETWLNSTVADLEVDINGYKIERLDRTSRGGGVAIYFRDGCKFKRRADLEDPNIEAICVELKIGKVCYILACVYRAPNSDYTNLLEYLDDLVRIATAKGFEIILIGDLNCDVSNPVLPQTIALEEFIISNQLKQLITEPTRQTISSKTLIDVLITSSHDTFTDSGIVETAISDHFPIYGIFACKQRENIVFFHTVESMKIALNLLFRLLIKSPGA